MNIWEDRDYGILWRGFDEFWEFYLASLPLEGVDWPYEVNYVYSADDLHRRKSNPHVLNPFEPYYIIVVITVSHRYQRVSMHKISQTLWSVCQHFGWNDDVMILNYAGNRLNRWWVVGKGQEQTWWCWIEDWIGNLRLFFVSDEQKFISKTTSVFGQLWIFQSLFLSRDIFILTTWTLQVSIKFNQIDIFPYHLSILDLGTVVSFDLVGLASGGAKVLEEKHDESVP